MNVIIKVHQDQQASYGSRYSGNRIRQQVVAALDAGNDTVTLDFAGVDGVAPGFVDELLGLLVYHCGTEWFGRHIRWVHAASEVEDDIRDILRFRTRLRDQRIAVRAA